MKIYDETKTAELSIEELDFSKGYLKNDKVIAARHEAAPAVKGKSAKEIYEELKSQGEDVEARFYKVLQRYANGSSDVEEIADEEDIPAEDAWDETEEIQVFVPYTEKELAQQELSGLQKQYDETRDEAVQFSIGELTEEEFAPIRAKRKELRDRIKVLKELLNEGEAEE